ncbi:hybrid sensor histidine kinase/response regulator [Azospirillum sp.]|uniref:hybrid sensor histidine kinase/response regulator n=1 Tax=Azospirillum sp. TaxID=34012 RepID=UPI002D4384EA|nr:response regulator [Azospirillum sp.]HYD64971.1 response regulator [Azospirillum sp.]
MIDIRQRLLAAFELEHKEHLAEIRAALRAAEEGTALDLDELHRRAHSLKGAARAVDLPEVEAVAHRVESTFQALQKGALALDGPAVGVLFRALDAIEDLAGAARGGRPGDPPGDMLADLDRLAAGEASVGAAPRAAPETPRPAGPADPAVQLVRINSASLGHFLETAAALLPEVEGQGQVAADLRRLRLEWLGLEQAWARLRRGVIGRGHRRNGSASGGVSAAQLDAFERRLRAATARIEGASRAHQRSYANLRQWSGSLQDDVRRLRMLPAETQFGDLGRMVRELARGQGKEVEVDVQGLSTEADREVLQRLKDPVIHLVRNAVSHGIETPTARLEAGKRAAGRIVVAIAVRGGRLTVRIEDDGRGVDDDAIARRAVQRGLLDAEEVADTPRERLRQFLLEPGFSTAEAVTELSGRGMGMSIVREALARLQGTLMLDDRRGGGTVVTLSAPVLLSNRRLLFVAVREHVLALQASDVVRLHHAAASDVFTLGGASMLRLGDEDLPVTTLAAYLGVSDAPPSSDRLAVVVVRRGEGEGPVAMVVDGFLTARDGLISSIDEVGLDPARFLGTVLLEDGAPALVVNLAGVGAAMADAPAFDTGPATAAGPPPVILVVDDSITTRTLERSILEAHGYTVELCVDGRDALERLGSTHVDLIVSDVEMPHMDGFTLLQSVKGDPRTAALPFILVTSRDAEEDRARGLRLGADAYIVKTRFDQGELLEGIRRLL